MLRTIAFLKCVSVLTASLGIVINTNSARAEEYEIGRFERSIVQTELIQPMELEIAPDGLVYIIELGGTLKCIDPKTKVATVAGKLTVTTEQENGLIGMALDPNFSSNGWIYLQYSPPDFIGQYVSRFELRDGQLDMASEKRLFSYEEQRRECCHHAGSMEFGPDGNLYIGTGDNTNPFNDSEGFAPLDQRPNREPWDAQRSAGNTKSYNGKVLRIRPEADGTYSIPDGNLFPKDGSIGHPEIYVMGCRNPWRISVDQRTGFLYWGDVGPDAGGDGSRGPRGYDEVNQARQAGNFGWPYFIGDNFAYSMVNFETGDIGTPFDATAPVNESVNNSGAKHLPPATPALIYYPSGESSEFPAVMTGGRTACAGPVYYFDDQLVSDVKFPAAFDSTLFAFEWSRNWIMAVHLNEDGSIASMERFLPDMPFSRPIDLQFDSNGALYVLEYGETWGVNVDSRLVRIEYARGNRAPMAIAKLVNSVGREPLTVTLLGNDSTDKDQEPLSYSWSYVRSGDEQATRHPLANEVQAEVTFEQPGVYTVELEVKDAAGATSISSVPVIVGNSAPEVVFQEPRDGDFFTPGEPLPYRLVVRDREDGTSDPEEAEEDGWHLIESHAPSRLFVEAITQSNIDDSSNDSPGLALIRRSDCLNCHATNRRLVGPSFVEIADKYRNDPHQLPKSAARVREGSTGVWGKIGMLPHQQHTEAEVLQMVEHVFSVTADKSNPSAQGFTNEFVLDADSGRLRLEATYTDLGRDDIPKLDGIAVVTLRSRTIQAEAADAFQGSQKLGSDRAEGKAFMGGINHDGYLQLDGIRMDDLTAMSARVASAGVGGVIEIHSGSVDGPLLATMPVEVNGNWEEFYEKRVELSPSTGRATIYLVFKNETNRGGLMNVDSVTFH